MSRQGKGKVRNGSAFAFRLEGRRGMKKLAVALALMVSIFALSNLVLATPICGTYSILGGTIQSGVWQEDFSKTTPPGTMGVGGSILTGNSSGGGPPYQWSMNMTSQQAINIRGTTPPGVPPPTLQTTGWDYQTPYTGKITIGGTLINDLTPVTFNVTAMNYNVTYGNYKDFLGRSLLEWRFIGEGTTSDGYILDFNGYYLGAPTLSGYVMSGSLNQMDVTITKAPVPEPTTLLLLGIGLVGLAGFGRKKFFRK
jgi:hypothetical protein